MKMMTGDYAALETEIRTVEDRNGIEKLAEYRRNLTKDDRVKDVDKRYRWDLLWAIDQERRYPLLDGLYRYLNDSHIDTALRRIVKKGEHQ